MPSTPSGRRSRTSSTDSFLFPSPSPSPSHPPATTATATSRRTTTAGRREDRPVPPTPFAAFSSPLGPVHMMPPAHQSSFFDFRRTRRRSPDRRHARPVGAATRVEEHPPPPPYSRRAPAPPRPSVEPGRRGSSGHRPVDLYGDMVDLLLHDGATSTVTASSTEPASVQEREPRRSQTSASLRGLGRLIKRSFSGPSSSSSSSPAGSSGGATVPVLAKSSSGMSARRPSKSSFVSASSSRRSRNDPRVSSIPFPTLGDDPTWKSCPLPEPTPSGTREAHHGIPYSRARLPSVESGLSTTCRHPSTTSALATGRGVPVSRWSSSGESTTLHISNPPPPPSRPPAPRPRPPRSPSTGAAHRHSMVSSTGKRSSSSSTPDSVLIEGPATISRAAKVSLPASGAAAATIAASRRPPTSSIPETVTATATGRPMTTVERMRRKETERLLELGAAQSRLEREMALEQDRWRGQTGAGGAREERTRTRSGQLAAAAAGLIRGRKRTGSGASAAGEMRPYWAN